MHQKSFTEERVAAAISGELSQPAPVDSQLIGPNEQANIYNSYICTKITANFVVGIFEVDAEQKSFISSAECSRLT